MAPDFVFIFLPALITIRRTKPDPPPSVPVAFSVCLPLADVSLDGIMFPLVLRAAIPILSPSLARLRRIFSFLAPAVLCATAHRRAMLFPAWSCHARAGSPLGTFPRALTDRSWVPEHIVALDPNYVCPPFTKQSLICPLPPSLQKRLRQLRPPRIFML